MLARREDLAFLQLDCTACRSTTLGLAAGGVMDQPAARPPVSGDDVLDMHELLATWTGDLASLLSAEPSP